MVFFEEIGILKLLSVFNYTEVERSEFYHLFEKSNHKVYVFLSEEHEDYQYYDNYGNTGNNESLFFHLAPILTLEQEYFENIISTSQEFESEENKLQPITLSGLKSQIALFFLPEQNSNHKDEYSTFLTHSLFKGKIFSNNDQTQIKAPLLKLPSQSTKIELANIVESYQNGYEYLFDTNGYNDFNFSKEGKKSFVICFNPFTIFEYYKIFKSSLKDLFLMLIHDKFSWDLSMYLEEQKKVTGIDTLTFAYSGLDEIEAIFEYVIGYSNCASSEYQLSSSSNQNNFIELYFRFQEGVEAKDILFTVSKIVKGFSSFFHEHYSDGNSVDFKGSEYYTTNSTIQKLIYVNSIHNKKIARLRIPKNIESLEYIIRYLINSFHLNIEILKL